MHGSTVLGKTRDASIGRNLDIDDRCSVARDFVEAPSQMLENWCWEPKVLAKMSSHYKTQEPLSPELIDKIIKRYVFPFDP